MNDTIVTLQRSRIVPIVTIGHPAEVDAIASGLVAGGIAAVEITLRSEHGLSAIRRIAQRGDIRVGAGTVLTEEDATRAAEAGASFVVSPGFDERVVAASEAAGTLPLPGVATATEIQRARDRGLRHLKVFPIATVGGTSFLDAVSGPFRDVAFMLSGGVTLSTAARYLSHPSVFCVGGSWLVPPQRDGDLEEAVRGLAAATLQSLAETATDD